VCDGLQDNSQSSNTNSNIKQVGSKEKVVVISKDGKNQVKKLIDKWLERMRQK